MENLLLPSTIQIQDGDQPHRGRVVITPCYHGYGTTMGNALRRVLLSSLPGAAVIAVKIKGVQHEFSTVPGVKEDIVDIVLNLKKLRLRVFSAEPVTITLRAKGVGEVTANAIKTTSDVEIINKDFVIATITDAKTELEMELTVSQGRGYVPVEERKRATMDIGTIAIDAIYTPIVDVGYSVDFTRVGDVTNYEKLTLDIETDGTISPKDALNQAVEILMDHLRIIQGGMESVGLEKEEAPSAEDIAEEATDAKTVSKDAVPEAEEEEETKEDEGVAEEPAEEEEEESKEE